MNTLACIVCGRRGGSFFVVDDDDIKDHPYLAKYRGEDMCYTCMEKLEIEYVKELPLEDLPLLVNKGWQTHEARAAYEERLNQ